MTTQEQAAQWGLDLLAEMKADPYDNPSYAQFLEREELRAKCEAILNGKP